MKLARPGILNLKLPARRLDQPSEAGRDQKLERAFEGREGLHLLMVALRVNASVALPLAVVVTLASGPWDWREFGSNLFVVLVFTNVSFVLLNTFYHRVWQLTRRLAHKVGALLALPLLGALASVLCKVVIDLIDPGLLSMGLGSVTLAGTTITVVSGLAMFIIEDNRRRRRVNEKDLEGSRRREKEASDAQTVAEIIALQAMIKPHFVFNTLNSIAALIPEDPEKAEETTIRLSRLLRYLVDIQDNMMVTLGTEMEVVEAHLEIEKVRLGDRLEYRIEIPEGMDQILIPAMILQPLFENAVEHGIRQRRQPGLIDMKASIEDADCVVRIVDNGPGFSTHRGAGRALGMLRKRLDRLYGKSYTLSLGRDEVAGETTVELRFPHSTQNPS